jgi:hypothetical protein
VKYNSRMNVRKLHTIQDVARKQIINSHRSNGTVYEENDNGRLQPLYSCVKRADVDPENTASCCQYD